ncbi:hypothetical protein BC832DRAFT_535958, partial [Gaertneriomyces semiglobifer]
MISQGIFSYYVGELAWCQSGGGDVDLLLIEGFCVRQGYLHVKGKFVFEVDNGYWISNDEGLFRTECLLEPGPDLSEVRGRYEIDCESSIRRRIHYNREYALAISDRARFLREKAQGKRIVMVPLILFCDDVSGNVSKKWNANYNWYFQLAGLPFEYTQLDYNVHFLATSNTLSPLQIGREVLQDVVSGLEKGINAYDVMQREEILAVGGVFLIECDNPMANELAAGIDIRRGLRFCRFCEVKRDATTGHMQVSFPAISVEDMISPMFRLGYGFSGHRHIPVEILHTFSLGLIKYLMVASIKELSDKDQKVLTVRIDALSSVGFPKPLRGNQLIQYVGSLQGKDRRAFVQVAVPVFQGLLSQKWLKAWQYLATVSVQLFSRRISDVDTYLDVLQRSLQAMMATIADINVSWLSAHAKYHTLAHVVENIREFGPAVLYMSEKFESFNKVMRNHAVHTNRHGPSVDVARRFARYAVVRHLLSGGMFKSEGRWSSPGDGLRQTFYDPIVQRVLGYKEEG